MIQNINNSFLITLQKGRTISPQSTPANRDFSSWIRSRVCKTDSTDACKYWNTIYLFTNRNAKVYSHESTWRGWKTRGLAHRFPLRKLSLRRSSSLNHLTESSPRSTTRPLRLASSRVLCCPFSHRRFPSTEQSVKFQSKRKESRSIYLEQAGGSVDSSVVSVHRWFRTFRQQTIDKRRWFINLRFPFLVGEYIIYRNKIFLFFFFFNYCIIVDRKNCENTMVSRNWRLKEG